MTLTLTLALALALTLAFTPKEEPVPSVLDIESYEYPYPPYDSMKSGISSHTVTPYSYVRAQGKGSSPHHLASGNLTNNFPVTLESGLDCANQNFEFATTNQNYNYLIGIGTSKRYLYRQPTLKFPRLVLNASDVWSIVIEVRIKSSRESSTSFLGVGG